MALGTLVCVPVVLFAAFSSVISDPAQVEIRVNRIARAVTPDFSNITDIREYIRLSVDIGMQRSMKACGATSINVNIEQLRQELLECWTIQMAAAVKLVSRLQTYARTRWPIDQRNLQTSFHASSAVPAHLRRSLSSNVFEPFCSEWWSKCNSPKYEMLTKALECRSELDSDGDKLWIILMADLCRNNASWIFDFLNAKPCPGDFVATFQSDDFQQRRHRVEVYRKITEEPGAEDRITGADTCRMTLDIGRLVTDLLVIDSCPPGKSPSNEPGQIFLNAFRDTRNFWNAKCEMHVSHNHGRHGGLTGVYHVLWCLCLLLWRLWR